MDGPTMATLIMAAATCFMAIAVFWQARKTGELVKLNEEMLKENHRLAERSRITELIGQGLDPLIDSMQQVEIEWRGGKFSSINIQDITISGQVESKFKFNRTLYYDLKEMEPSLIRMIEDYDNKVEEFWRSLLDLSDSGSQETTIQILNLANADAVRGLIGENVPKFREEIKKILAKSSQVRDKYRHEYNLTKDDLKDSKAKIKIPRSLRGIL